MVKWGHIIYGGVNSADYGIYITGEAVYNAPERDGEFIEVPGRNGAIFMDNRRYRNITVTYPAGAYGGSQKEFREKMTRFRNAIISQIGYQKLEDTYHPDEYRMGVYTSGLEVEAVAHGKAGEFNLVFECKPQRWLAAGALPIPIDSGDVLQNPTPFSSGPLLEIEGYGFVWFNGQSVKLENAVLGNTLLNDSFVSSISTTDQLSIETSNEVAFDGSLFNTGDTITVKATKFRTSFYTQNVGIYVKSNSGSGSPEGSGAIIWPDDNYTRDIEVRFTDLSFVAGTAKTYQYTYTAVFQNQSNVEIGTIQLVGTIDYSYSQGVHTISFQVTATATSGSYYPQGAKIFGGQIIVASTLSILGNPTYIDCEMGEAYRIVDGEAVSLNSKVALGSDLPTLKPGSNKVTYSNTITDLKIVPRWWRV